MNDQELQSLFNISERRLVDLGLGLTAMEGTLAQQQLLIRSMHRSHLNEAYQAMEEIRRELAEREAKAKALTGQ